METYAIQWRGKLNGEVGVTELEAPSLIEAWALFAKEYGTDRDPVAISLACEE